MRNLKRALSLTLASVMLLGMMVVGTSAAGFPDVDDADNVEAIEVLQAVGIMVGDKDTGNFRPDAPVSRAEMAVVMAILQNLTTSYYVSTCPFTDVSGSYDWARGPVGACYATGVISGRSATSFDPAATVTAVEAAAMMLRALGYFKYTEDYADGFQLSIVRQANQIGLFSGIEGDATSPMTRNQVAKLTLNALQANLVDFTGTPGIEVNGVKIGYKPEYTFRSGTDPKYRAISDLGNNDNTTGTNQSYVQLGEERYDGDLRLYSDETDDFGRPSRQWDYKGEEIGTYAKKELISKTYTVKAEGGDVYSDIGAAACDYALEYWIDGVPMSAANTAIEQNKLERRNDSRVGETGRGVLTEIYVDTLNRETTIVEIHTYLAQAATDYNATSKRLPITIYTDRALDGTLVTDSKRLEEEDLPAITKYKEDDFLMVTMADGEVKSVADPQVVSDVSITNYKSSSDDRNASDPDRLTWVTANGTQYDISEEAYYDEEYLFDYSTNSQQMYGYTYNLLLDEYGYLLGLENVSDGTNFFFIVGYEEGAANWGKSIDKAYVIFPDGSTGTVNCQERDGVTAIPDSPVVNAWYDYSINADNVYEIRGLTDKQFVETRTDDIDSEYDTMAVQSPVYTGSFPTYVYGGDKSVYISVDIVNIRATTWSIDDVNGVTTGLRNTSITMLNSGSSTVYSTRTTGSHNVFGLYDSKGYVTYAIVLGDSGVGDFVYIASGVKESKLDGREYRYRYDAIVPGESDVTEVWTKDLTVDVNNAAITAHSLYKVARDSNGLITRMELMTQNADHKTATYKTDGYAMLNVAGNTAAVEFKEAGTRTLVFPAVADNDRYILLAPDCQFFVNGTNRDNTKKSSYENVGSVNSALTALGTDATGVHLLTPVAAAGASNFARFTAITNSNGQATTVIFWDRVYEDNATPGGGGAGAGTIRGVDKVLTVDTSSVTGNTTAIHNMIDAYVKSQDDGVYQVSGDGAYSNGAYFGNPQDYLYFKFTTSSTDDTFRVTITDARTNAFIYSEGGNNLGAGPHYIMVQIVDSTGSNQIDNNNGVGSLTTAPLPAGTYNYTVTSGTNVMTGTFTVR